MRRREGFLVQELADETVIYDRTRHKAHCLNKTAALVWHHCDGQTSLADIANRLNDHLSIPADEQFVRLALDRLQKAGLLQTDPTTAEKTQRFSRRDLGRKLGVAGLLIPAVMTIVAPTAAAANSDVCCGSSCHNDNGCNCTGCPHCNNKVNGTGQCGR
jgi:hypothetical protein